MLKKEIRFVAIIFMANTLVFTLASFGLLLAAIMHHGSAAPALTAAWFGLINASKMIMMFQWDYDTTEEIEEN